MIYREDIEAALLAGNIRDVETAFRALVGYPGEDDIERPDGELLRDVCLALASDTSCMPSGTVDAIADTVGDKPETFLRSIAYDDGAEAVLMYLDRFAANFTEAAHG